MLAFRGRIQESVGKAVNLLDRQLAAMQRSGNQQQERFEFFKHKTKMLGTLVDECQLVVFERAQALALLDSFRIDQVILSYRLPFEATTIWFTQPIGHQSHSHLNIIGLVLGQIELGEIGIEADAILNHAYAIFDDYSWIFFTWKHRMEDAKELWILEGNAEQFPHLHISNTELRLYQRTLVDLATACIGFINCENIHLHKHEGASEAINRKRERKGKSRIDPYYVCRIRGVQYDSSGNPTGQGTQHGHIYDVRGHFRKLTSGKTTWVRPHLRGIHSGGPYVPKTYLVDRDNP